MLRSRRAVVALVSLAVLGIVLLVLRWDGGGARPVGDVPEPVRGTRNEVDLEGDDRDAGRRAQATVAATIAEEDPLVPAATTEPVQVRFVVRDTKMQPLAGAEVEVFGFQQIGFEPKRTTDAEGRCAYRDVRPGDLSYVEVRLPGYTDYVRHSLHRERIWRPVTHDVREMEIYLERAGSLVLDLVGTDGRPLANHPFHLAYAGTRESNHFNPDPFGIRTARLQWTDDFGQTTVEGLHPGIWEIVAYAWRDLATSERETFEVTSDVMTGHRHVVPDSEQRFVTGTIHVTNEIDVELDGLLDSVRIEVDGAINSYPCYADGAFFLPARYWLPPVDGVQPPFRMRVLSRDGERVSDWIELPLDGPAEIWTVTLQPR